ncbi:SDR family oxidoreductase [Limibacter armeniacum]|uniref:SDR family oxidoreductase n=1 Tax=Limibacter armeniacum TaxID=466084 RepID=UPI002FE61D8B
MESLKGKTALVTGGSKGIGYGIAVELLKNGVHVAITSRTQQAADEAAESLRKVSDAEVLAFEADVRDLGSQQRVVDAIVKEWGKLDAVIANAGLGHFGSIEDLTAEQWQETIDTNLTGVFNSTKASLEALKQSKGYLITIASLAGTNFFANGSAYNASKFGVVGFSQAVMLDVRKYGIKVTTIMPGSVTSHFNGHEPNPDDAWKIQPEDLGQMTVDLLKMNPRTLPSKIEVRPTTPPSK